MFKKGWNWLKQICDWWSVTKIILMWLGIAIGVGIVLYIWGVMMFPDFVSKVEKRGQWGDSFGVIVAFFSGLGFIALIWTIRQSNKQHREVLESQQEELSLQRKELELQRKELTHTRAEIKGQKEQLAAQNKTLRHQNFESSFFQLLSLYNNIIDAMEFSVSGRHASKRGSFRLTHHTLRYDYTSNVSSEENLEDTFRSLLEREWDSAEEEKQFILKRINERYEMFFAKYQAQVGHYLRHLYNMVKFVDEKDFLTYEEKKRYTNLIRAQLSSYELAFLFSNCLSDEEKDFKPLVEKYALLKNIDFNLLLSNEHEKLSDVLKELYENGAYVESDSASKNEA